MDFSLFTDELDESKGFTVCTPSSYADIPVSLLHPVLVTGIRDHESAAEFHHVLCRRYAPAALFWMGCTDTHEKRRVSVENFEYPGEGTWCALLDPEGMIRKEVSHFSLQPILDVMKALREEGGCPWDRAQDHESLRTYLIQEAYEVVDAIDHKDMENLKEELGDVLFQVVFHARIAEEEGLFTMQDVVDGIVDKMIIRHPYVFGDMTAEETAALLGNWEVRKIREKKRSHLLSGLSASLPSLLFACIMQRKVSSISKETVSAEAGKCVFESSWRKAIKLAEQGGTEEAERCFGDALFETVRFLRAYGVDPELALHRYNSLYADQIGQLEDALHKEGRDVTSLTPSMLEEIRKNLSLPIR